MSFWDLPWEQEHELITAQHNRRRQFDWKKLHFDEGQAATLRKWARVAPWVPRGVLVPLAREGIDPESQTGRNVVKFTAGARPNGWQRSELEVAEAMRRSSRENAAAAPVSRGTVEAPEKSSSGILGDIGGALETVGRGVRGAYRTVDEALDTNREMGRAFSDKYDIPNPEAEVNTAIRTATGALQAGAEAADTAFSYRPKYVNDLTLRGYEFNRGTEDPFSLKQFSLYQMLHGADSGEGFFIQGEALSKAAEEQRRVRGTINGHALTPGRTIANFFVEPGTKPYQIMSGAVDAATDWKVDPAAVALTQLGDVNQARKVFDSYGMVNGHRTWLHGPTAVAWLESKAGDKFADAVAKTGSITELMRRTKNRWPAELYAAAVDARTPEQVKGLLKPVLGMEIGDVPKWGYDFGSAFEDMRWAHQMPRGSIDVENKDHAIQQMERLLVTGKVDRKSIDKIVYKVAKAENRAQLYDAVVKSGGDALADGLVNEYKLAKRDAKKLSTFVQDSIDSDRQYFIDTVADPNHVRGLNINGQVVPVDGPEVPSELLNRSIPLPDARELRRAASKLRPMMELPGVSGSVTLLDFMTDSVFKVGALARGAWTVRVIGEEQIRQAAAGLDSAFRHPMSWISWVVGGSDKAWLAKFGKGNVDIEDIPFNQLDDGFYFDSLSHGATFRGPAAGGAAETDKIFTKHFVPVRREAEEFPRAWADEISHLHLDPVARTVARNARNADGIAASKDWFWTSKYREELVDGGGWRSALAFREGSDSYIEDIVWDRIRKTTNDNSELIDAIADGADMRKGMRLNPNFVKKLEGLADEELAPPVIKGRLGVTAKRSGPEKFAEGYNHAVDRMFTVLMSKPTNYLSRSPAFKQFYWQRIDRMFGELAPDVQAQVMRVARNSKISLRGARKAGELGLEEADIIAKSAALDEVKALLYDVSERSNFFDAARIVFPFGEAWKEVATVWARQIKQNPQVLRRGQQVMQGARQSGFFYTDPEDGNEYYTIPFSQWINKRLTGVPFAQRSLVSGLNIVGQGLPGVGPAVQIPASHLIPDEPQWDAVREAVLPYGEPDVNAGVFEAFFPGWAQKFRSAGWLEPIIGASKNQERIFENTVKDVMAYKASTGAYDPTDPDDLAKLVHDSREAAKGLYAIRGMTQFVSPSAPQFVPKVKAKDGKLYELHRMARDYREMQDKDFEGATQQFIDKYGEKAFLAANPKTQQQVYNPPTTKQAKWWAAKNKEFTDAFPHVYGFFAPSSGDFDYNAYLRALDKGEIEPLDADDWLRAANHRLAAQIYSNKRAMVGNSPTEAQSAWLREWKQELLKEYPGYDPDGAHGKDISPEKAMIELRQASDAPNVKNTMLGKSVREYFTYRDQALEAAKKAGYATLSAERLRPLRDWLREWGDELSTRTPEFQAVWERLLYGEVRLEDEEDASQ